MATKDLIKKMSTSQAVKPAQLTKTIVEPETVRIDVVVLKEKETADFRIEQEVKELQKSESEKEAAKVMDKLVQLDKRCNDLQDALEVVLKENTSLEAQVSELSKRLADLDIKLEMHKNKSSFLKRLFKWA